ncbi:hypothetical protein M427DRAFT_35410 [Gonapodya prolifera JEL478]|uniref:Uncharacterized protein n=1 Tax=Gonapodya prolifera (strain JEL478) TaxID=1344416 RepID=A0A139A4V6_GONPJ|nr:hypothetical protein M427DRAFT_35410 [Gonapodya prolifera JEL478]|eukprot:KXS11836.1 hypothetical protein M427DRAFT_35410 [Gonapodya prolifera JEL478]
MAGHAGKQAKAGLLRSPICAVIRCDCGAFFMVRCLTSLSALPPLPPHQTRHRLRLLQHLVLPLVLPHRSAPCSIIFLSCVCPSPQRSLLLACYKSLAPIYLSDKNVTDLQDSINGACMAVGAITNNTAALAEFDRLESANGGCDGLRPNGTNVAFCSAPAPGSAGGDGLGAGSGGGISVLTGARAVPNINDRRLKGPNHDAYCCCCFRRDSRGPIKPQLQSFPRNPPAESTNTMRASLSAIALSALAVSLVAFAPARASTFDVAVIEKVTSLLTDVAALEHSTASRLAKRAPDCTSCVSWANNCLGTQGKCSTFYTNCICPASQKSLFTACINSLVGTSPAITADTAKQISSAFDQGCAQITSLSQAQLDALDQQQGATCQNLGSQVNLDACKGVTSGTTTGPAPAPAGANTQTKPGSATSNVASKTVLSIAAIFAVFALFA